MNQFHVVITTPTSVLYDSEVDSLTCETSNGEITLLSNHIAIVTAVVAGTMFIVKSGQTIPMVSGQGVLQFLDNECVLLLNTAEHVDAIDIERATAAAERARAYMQEQRGVNNVEYARMQSLVERNLARVRGVQRWKK